MFFRKQYKYIFLLIPLVLLYRPFLFFGNYQLDESVGNLFLRNLFGGSYSREQIEIVLSMTSFFGVIVMNILFGDYICKDFFSNSEYIFTREQNKGKWFLKKAFGLGGYCILGTMLYVGIYAMGSIMKSSRNVEVYDVTIMVFTTIMLLEFTYLTTLLVNVLALKFGTTIAFVITYSICIGGEIITFCLQKMDGSTLVKTLHYVNPMSNMTISWNYSDWSNYWSILYFFALNVVLLMIGRKMASNYEIKNKR